MQSFTSTSGYTTMPINTQVHEVVKHKLGSSHHILRTTQYDSSGAVKEEHITMFTVPVKQWPCEPSAPAGTIDWDWSESKSVPKAKSIWGFK